MSIAAQARQLIRLREKAAEATAASDLPLDIRELTGYNPRPLQQWLEANERRFNVEVIHRRFGKTVMKVNKLIERAVECPFPDGRYGYGAPTYAQAEDIAWHYLLNFTEKFPNRRVQEGKLSVWIPTRIGDVARIRLYGLDNPKQRIRGLYLDGFVFDEHAWIPPSAWYEQVRPMLTDENRAHVDFLGRPNQWADFIFTPFGRNHAYTIYRNADLWARGLAVTLTDPLTGMQEEVRRDDWFAARLKASETGVLNAAELMSARIDMGPSKYDQEYECSFDAAVEGAIYAREVEEARRQGRIGPVPIVKSLPVNTAWDLGYSDATAIWFFQHAGARRINVVDYYEASGAGVDHYADVMIDKGYRYGYHLWPHDGKQHNAFAGQGKSAQSVAREYGIHATIVPKVNRTFDAIEAGRSFFSRCYFDAERCADGLDRLSLYRYKWDEKSQTFTREPMHDFASHGANAFETLARGVKKGYGQGDDHNHSVGVF